MRQIKFRGKRLDSGEWVYGDLLQVCGGYIIYHGSQTESDEFEDDGKTAIYLYKNEVSAVHPDTIGQFTGLLDRNGKEIYKGDILIYIDKEANEHYREVVYHLGCFKFHNPNAKLPDTPIYHHLVDGGLNWEVIGNIHDNPGKKKK